MKQKILVVVDMQNDFVNGTLGTKEAESIVPLVVKKIKDFDGTAIFTQDTHQTDYLKTQEGKYLPIEHCIEHTDGWQLNKEIKELQQAHQCPCYKKGQFGSVELATDLLKRYKKEEIESIELIGLCTDICVVSNALILKAYMPQLPIYVDASCCAGVTPDKHRAALEVMRSCQIIVNNE